MGGRTHLHHRPICFSRPGCHRKTWRKHQYDDHFHPNILTCVCFDDTYRVPTSRKRCAYHVPRRIPYYSRKGGFGTHFTPRFRLFYTPLHPSDAPVDYIEAQSRFLFLGRFTRNNHRHHGKKHHSFRRFAAVACHDCRTLSHRMFRSVRHRACHWQTLRRKNKLRTGSLSEEYGTEHLGGLHVS